MQQNSQRKHTNREKTNATQTTQHRHTDKNKTPEQRGFNVLFVS